ncbi:MAG TPA: hypothetical protein VFC07_11660 [Verrucomicrobiae bacterium]|nr:hypothetical protein [Verrucomicrobiae bacterium]
MKRKSYGANPVKVIKTSISLPEVLLRFAEERCAKEGFNSFSAYVAHLVRMDKEKKDAGSTVDRGTAPAMLNEGKDEPAPNSPQTANYPVLNLPPVKPGKFPAKKKSRSETPDHK